jgi:transposase
MNVSCLAFNAAHARCGRPIIIAGIEVIEPALVGVNRSGFAGGFNSLEGGAMSKQTSNKFSPEVRSRAVRLVLDHEHEHPSRWATIVSVSAKIGCTAQTLLEWVKKAEVDSGKRAGVPTDMAEKLKALERENRELRQANEILRKATAYFAQAELDRRVKP